MRLGTEWPRRFPTPGAPGRLATVLERRFGSSAELKQSINSGAGIPLTGTPVSDGKAPANYIIATPDELALYASSRSYQADGGPDCCLEIDKLEFSDIALLTSDNPALLSQISAQFRGDYSLVQLYAIGIDA